MDITHYRYQPFYLHQKLGIRQQPARRQAHHVLRQLKKYDLDLEDEVFEVKVSGLGKDNNKKASKKKYSVDDVIDMHDWDF